LHSASATLANKPEVLTAEAIVTKEHWALFVPFNSSARMPDNAPCGGVETFEQNYAFIAWAQVSLNSNIGGVLEYGWLQDGLTSHGTTHKRSLSFLRFLRKRDLETSANDGNAHYKTPYTGQTTQDFIDGLPPV